MAKCVELLPCDCIKVFEIIIYLYRFSVLVVISHVGVIPLSSSLFLSRINVASADIRSCFTFTEGDRRGREVELCAAKRGLQSVHGRANMKATW